MKKIRERDWQKLSDEEVRRFLIFLFGENPGKSGIGITVYRENGHWRITFKGTVEFQHDIHKGRPIWHVFRKVAAHYNKQARQRRDEQVVALIQQT